MAARDAFIQTLQDAIRPDETITVAEWAAKYRVLPPSSPEPGRWRNERTPYLVGIMDALSGAVSNVTRYSHDDPTPFDNSWVVEIAQMKGHQVGGSSAGENFLGHAITTAPGNVLVVFPTGTAGKKWELDRFEPMRESTPALRKRIRKSGTKGSDNTKTRKKFPGGMLDIAIASVANSLKSTSVRYVDLEEPDEYPQNVEDQGSAIGLARNRTSNFGRRAKIFANGTPTLDGASNIAKLHDAGDQRKYFVACPECGHRQFFDWKNFKCRDDDFSTVACYCVDCGIGSPEHLWKTRGFVDAYWMPTAQGDGRTASFHLPAMYAPIGWRPWPEIAQLWHKAQSDAEAMVEFVNNVLGLPYKETVGNDVKADQLQARAEAYMPMTCPMGGLIAVAGVDVQDSRLAITVRAYGRGEESWGLFHDEIYGDPSSPETWKKLEDILLMPIRHASGQLMRVEAACIDTGGHHTHDVYAFCKTAQARGRHWLAIRGAKPIDAPILGKPKVQQFNWQGQPVPGGVQLRQVGTQAIKSRIDYRLREISKHGAGFMHFPMAYTADYYSQMRSEKRVWARLSNGTRARMWQCPAGVRNEAWDCEVYAYAAFSYLTSSNADVAFTIREKVFHAGQRDLFVESATPADPDTSGDLGASAEVVRDAIVTEVAEPIAPQPAMPLPDQDVPRLPDVSPLSPLNPARSVRRGRRMVSRGY
ncbi:phage terminase large subunit family protein [Paraburkholderia tropica]|uniref:phage terminase large subunit family protein n=1 Tax=Paraburkholderia tropica TaxID=92647 RepID=UPI001622BA72|nr:terminase gpA endonuclease subunit [Paraburkholderia tropica]MBB6319255.1 phage terminase large subunit GpA-like protein [Paraburkholderia tropica]